MDNKDKLELNKLLIELIEGSISSERMEILDGWLHRSPEALDLYREFIKNMVVLKRRIGVVIDEDGGSLEQELWRALAEEERKAPAVEIPKEEPPKGPVPRVVHERVPQKVNKLSLYSAIISAAALLFLVLFIRFAGSPSGPEVATLTDSLNARWAAANGSLLNGARLTVERTPLILQEGLAELQFDNEARVVVEAPAEFQILAEDRIGLRYGKLYAVVSPEAVGFSVYTRNAKVIDLGTEFGISVDSLGDTSLHMVKGKTRLIAGGASHKVNLEVVEGAAKKISATTQAVSDIPFSNHLFARAIDSNRKLVWKGQSAISLADIVGGGNGLGTGKNENAIDPLTGKMEIWKSAQDRQGEGRYVPVSESTFIDGVFVPDGGQGPVQVTSAGHTWDCPDTSNLFKYSIVNSLRIPANLEAYADYSGTQPKEDMLLSRSAEKNVPLRLMGPMGSDVPPDPSDSSLFIHGNLGITFDLNAIRTLMPHTRLAKFSSTFGIGEITDATARLDLWILVDGQAKISRQDVNGTSLIDVDVELSDTDRFLTLVVTDGKELAFSYDWGLFMNPRLEME